MTFAMTPGQEAKYRATKDIHVGTQRHCVACKKRRSIAQFVEGDTICMQCRRRVPVTNNEADTRCERIPASQQSPIGAVNV